MKKLSGRTDMKHFALGLVAAASLLAGTAQAQQSIVVGHSLSPTSHYGLGAQAFIDTLTEFLALAGRYVA